MEQSEHFEVPACVLCAGTLRPDLIESASELASGSADTIKTHHNDTDLVRQLRQQVTGFTYLQALYGLQDYNAPLFIGCSLLTV